MTLYNPNAKCLTSTTFLCPDPNYTPKSHVVKPLCPHIPATPTLISIHRTPKHHSPPLFDHISSIQLFIPMATSTFLSAQTINTPSASISISLRRAVPAAKLHSFSARPIGRVASRPSSTAVRAELNASLVISLSTGLSLFLGRFVFFNFQRENVAKQVPAQNGKTHFEAGDARAKEYVGILKSNDPVGFNIVDVLAWGSIGHVVAYYILATSSNGYEFPLGQ